MPQDLTDGVLVLDVIESVLSEVEVEKGLEMLPNTQQYALAMINRLQAKIDLMNPKNLWFGGLLFKGGMILINHPILLSANTNAASLNMRVENVQTFMTRSAVDKAPAPSGDSSNAQNVSTGSAKNQSIVSIRVDQTAQSGKAGLITVEVTPEVTSGARGFTLELDPTHLPNTPAGPSSAVTAVQADGRALPNWLKFDAQAKTFSAESVPPGAFPLQVKVSVGGADTVIVIQDAGNAAR